MSRAFSSENLAETSQLFDKNEIWSHKFMVRNHSSIKNGPLFIYLTYSDFHTIFFNNICLLARICHYFQPAAGENFSNEEGEM